VASSILRRKDVMEKEKNLTMDFEETDEFVVRDMLREKAKDIETFDDLVDFLKYIKDNCNTGYGTAPRAMAQAALAVSHYLSGEFGITGFQAGFVMWDFITGWTYTGNKCGLKMVDYDNMLFPQYGYKFEKTISSDVWESLKKQAEENLKDKQYAHPDVIAHWQSIVDGKVPFGYSVKED
jgi:hypothetical protein